MMVIPADPTFDQFMADAQKITTDPSEVLDLVAIEVLTALLIKRSSDALTITTTSSNTPSFNHSLVSNSNLINLFPPIPRRKRSPASARNHYVKMSTSRMGHDLDYQNQENIIGGKRKFEVKQTKKIKRLFAEDKEETEEVEEKKTIKKPKNKEKKKIKKPSTRPMVRSTKALNPEPLRPELEAQIRALGGQNAKLVIQKYLYPTDVNPGHDRLSIPELQVQDRTFLTKDEADLLYHEGGELKVKVLEPCGFVSDMILKKWNMPSTRNLNLRTYWTKLMKRNKDEYDEKTGKLIERKFFDAGDTIQVWSFRVSRDNEEAAVAEEEDPGQLWLALINLSRPVPNNADEQVVQLV